MRGPMEIIAAMNLPKVTGVLQVGASNGQEIPYFQAHGVQYAALVEPLDGPYGRLCQGCQGIPGYVPIQALCGPRDGQVMTFHLSSNNGESSSILAPTAHLTDYPYVTFPATAQINSFRLDSVFAALSANRPDVSGAINMLFMDVQGAELEVLKGAGAVLDKVDYIYTEVGLGDGYAGAVAVEDLLQYLRAYGFRICDLEMHVFGNAMLYKWPNRGG